MNVDQIEREGGGFGVTRGQHVVGQPGMCKGLLWTCRLEGIRAPDPRSSPHRSSPPAQLLT